MPDGSLHRRVGAISGGAVAAYCARNEEFLNFIAETLGGALAGALGGFLPDNLDPPSSGPWHRSWAHGVVPAAAGLAWCAPRAPELQAAIRRRALECERLAGVSPGLEGIFCAAGWILFRMVAGAVYGLPAGYLSHLVLDAGTPRGLPALC